MFSADLIQAHKHSSYHKDEIQNSEICGCFYCLAIFKPQVIEEWVEEQDGIGQTALCPMCGVDSVIGSKSGFLINQAFLQKMHQKWF
jgi:hypothetical protein